jgi:hypothetical protein
MPVTNLAYALPQISRKGTGMSRRKSSAGGFLMVIPTVQGRNAPARDRVKYVPYAGSYV